jgi:hypothetical protein
MAARVKSCQLLSLILFIFSIFRVQAAEHAVGFGRVLKPVLLEQVRNSAEIGRVTV